MYVVQICGAFWIDRVFFVFVLFFFNNAGLLYGANERAGVADKVHVLDK